MKIISRFITSLIIPSLLYAGLFMHIEWAENVGLFLVWLLLFEGMVLIICFGIFLIADDSTFKAEGNLKNFKRRGFVKYINRFIITFNIAMLVATGHFIIGGIWTVLSVIVAVMYSALIDKAERIIGTGDATEN